MNIRRGLMKTLEEILMALLIYFAIAATVIGTALATQSEATGRAKSTEKVGSPPPEPPEWLQPVITGVSVVTLDVGHDRNLPLLY